MLETIVWVILLKADQVFLLRSKEEWALIGGHVESKESLKTALQREILEEVGIKIEEKKLEFQCVIDRRLDDNIHKIHFVFTAKEWNGTPSNKEEKIHDEGKWYSLNNLPTTLGPLATLAIASLRNDKKYYEHP